MDNIKRKIGTNLKKIRLSRGLKQSELAEMVGVEDKTISRIEVGGNYPSMSLLVRLSDVLKCELVDFVNFGSEIQYNMSELSKDELNAVKKFVNLVSESCF